MDNQNGNDVKGKIELLRKVRQIRQFTTQPVPEDVINDILEVARWTGSAMNQQPWEFVLVRDHAQLKEMASLEGSSSHIAGADFAIVVIMKGQTETIEAYDEGRLSERLLIAAEAHGLGAGIWWFKDGGAAARKVLGIPEGPHLRTAVSFGYPDKEAIASRPKKPDARKPLSELVHDGKY